MSDYQMNSLQGRKILVIDDHKNIRISLRLTLESEGAVVQEADRLGVAMDAFEKALSHNPQDAAFSFDLILLDIRLPDGNGLDALKWLSDKNLSSRVIMISGEGTAQEAFQATQMGAFDYVEKPFLPERLLVSVKRCLDFGRIQSLNANLLKTSLRGMELIGFHPAITEIMAMMKRVGPTNGRVLIMGESGTGKELVARGIHRASSRSDRAMIKVNCAAIPPHLIESELFGHEKGAFTGAIKTRQGVFERASGGTLFLDEVGELTADVQAKLLRVLQNGEIVRLGGERTIQTDVRLITATNRDLEDMVQQGDFREDLFYRLNVVTIRTPSLRERRSDIPILAQMFLEEACEEHSLGPRSFHPQALEQLSHYDWPGNVRELKNLVERLAILSEDGEIENVPELVDHSPRHTAEAVTPLPSSASNTDIQPWHVYHESVSKKYLQNVIERVQGNVSEAARLLELDRAYLHRLMKKFGIQRG